MPQRCHEARGFDAALSGVQGSLGYFWSWNSCIQESLCRSHTEGVLVLFERRDEPRRGRGLKRKRKETNQERKEGKGRRRIAKSEDVLTKRIIDRAVNTNVVGHRFVVWHPSAVCPDPGRQFILANQTKRNNRQSYLRPVPEYFTPFFLSYAYVVFPRD